MIKILIRVSIAILMVTSVSCQKKSVKLINSWKVGTSSGLFNDFSNEEFVSFKNIGIDFIEIGSGVFRNKSDEECKEWIEDIRKKSEAAGIKIWSIHLPFSRTYDVSTRNDTDRVKMINECVRIMNLCIPLKPAKFVIHGGSEPIPDSIRAERIDLCVASLRILTAEAQKVNGQLALECLPRTCLGNTSGELLNIVNAVGGNLGVCFDSNHLLKEKPEEFVGKVGKLISTVHISDYDGIDERHWLPGDGIIGWNSVISGLVNSGFRGPFMFEASKRKPGADGTQNPVRLTPAELCSCFEQLKKNFIESL